MSRSMFGWMRAALLGSVVAGMVACGSSGSSDATTTGGGRGCTPGKQEEGACPGGTRGVQPCADGGQGWKGCEGGDASSSSSGPGGGGGATGTMGPMCGDGAQQAGECDRTSEGHISCAADWEGTTASSSASTGTGDVC